MLLLVLLLHERVERQLGLRLRRHVDLVLAPLGRRRRGIPIAVLSLEVRQVDGSGFGGFLGRRQNSSDLVKLEVDRAEDGFAEGERLDVREAGLLPAALGVGGSAKRS